MTLRIGSLCSGYEGLSLAVHAVIGGDLAWVADNDPGASAILGRRFPYAPNLGDINEANWSTVEPPDIVCAGFPCQDISYAGRGAGIREGNRSGLWYVLADALGVLRPRLVVLENVAGIVARRPGLDVVLADLARLGFHAEWLCLRAADVGAPHGRARFFLVAWPAADAGGGELQRRGTPGFPGIQASAEPREGDQRERAGYTAGDSRTATPADTKSDGRNSRRPEHAWQPRGSRAPLGCPVAAEDADRATGGERRIAAPGQAAGGWPRADAGGPGGASAAPDPDSDGQPRGPERSRVPGRPETNHVDRRVDPLRRVLDWGPYEAAVRRWEAILGRPAPRPTEPGRTGERLSPQFVEWMMGLPEGWVTDVPGLSRNAQLKALGNGVVPQQAAMALRLLLERADIPLLEHLASEEAA
jgi:DNA (cytosine-5)-methyltransferase 1